MLDFQGKACQYKQMASNLSPFSETSRPRYGSFFSMFTFTTLPSISNFTLHLNPLITKDTNWIRNKIIYRQRNMLA